MEQCFRYKQRYIPKAVITFIFAFFLVIPANHDWYLSIPFYAVFLAFQAVIFVYYLTKRMLVTDEGIQVKILWNVTISQYRWNEMTEARVNDNAVSAGRGMSGGLEATSLVYWIARKSVGRVIIIIINERPSFSIRLKEIKKSAELYKILEQKVRFVP